MTPVTYTVRIRVAEADDAYAVTFKTYEEANKIRDERIAEGCYRVSQINRTS